MKHIGLKHAFCTLFLVLATACIGEDIIDDFVEPSLRIDNPIEGLQVNTSHSYTATYFNTIGQPEPSNILWSSSDESIIIIDQNGLATAIGEGEATIMATANSVSDSDIIMAVAEEVEEMQAAEKNGTIVTTSSYVLEGTFTLSENENGGLDLDIANDYRASSNLPGLYLYLSNNSVSPNGAFEVGAVEVFNGAHSYKISDVKINDYKYLLYWCEPFAVKVGEGRIE